jgi:class 3 adenylate cyclase
MRPASPDNAITPGILDQDRLERGFHHPSIEMSQQSLDICKKMCGSCPSYPGEKGEALWCATGASRAAATIEKKGCNCVVCPLYDLCSTKSTGYFCIQGACGGGQEAGISRAQGYEDRFQPEPKDVLATIAPTTAPARIAESEVTLHFVGDKEVQASTERSILANSLEAGINHTHVCGGRARCSTCRVIVLEGAESLEKRNEAESRLALRKGFPAEVRLACQTYPAANMKLRRLVLDEQDTAEAMHGEASLLGEAGREVEVTVLFSDIRSFTSFSEQSLPYDVVHILNRYFESIGSIIDTRGGYIDKYIGDGIMVLFGLDQSRGTENHARLAADASLKMLEALDEFNTYLKKHFDHEFRIGIGLHTGQAVVGTIGYNRKRQYTAIGDTVNTASRIESVTKRAGTPILVSDNTRRMAGSDFDWGKRFQVKVKGKDHPLQLHELKS